MEQIPAVNYLCIRDFNNDEHKIAYSIEEPKQLLLDYKQTNAGLDHESVNVSSSEVFDVEYEEIDTEAHKIDLKVAFSSGILCSIMDVFFDEETTLLKLAEDGKVESAKIIIKIAKLLGNKEDNLQSALKFLKKYKNLADLVDKKFGSPVEVQFKKLSYYPNAVGLICSILAQFTYTVYGIDSDGNLTEEKIDCKNNRIGRNFVEKITFGTLNWVFNYLTDIKESDTSAAVGIPAPIVSLLKEIANLPIVEDVYQKYKDKADEKFYAWLSELFHDVSDTGLLKFDLAEQMKYTSALKKDLLPIVVNECIVRSFYFVSRLKNELVYKQIDSIEKLQLLDPKEFLPYNSRTLTRMLTIATGTFCAIDAASAAAAVAVKKLKNNDTDFVYEFITRINIAGLERFGLSLTADAKYIYQDIGKLYQEYQEKIYVIHRETYAIPDVSFSYTELQTRIIFSVEYQTLIKDIADTNDEKQKEKKLHWTAVWKNTVEKTYKKDNPYLIEDSAELVSVIRNELKKTKNDAWLNAVLLEAGNFAAYTKLSDDKKNEYKGLKLKETYIKDVLCSTNEVLTLEQYKMLQKTYHGYIGTLSNNSAKLMAGIAVTAVVTVASGGTASFFAPEIATAIMGSSFVGLYGAALTSASLAALGGGALTAGGFGMAGGAALIAGGGAVVGLLGGGVISTTSVIFGSSKELTLYKLSKMLTIAKDVFADKYHDTHTIDLLYQNMDIMIDNMGHDIEVMNDKLSDIAQDEDNEINQNNSKDIKHSISTMKSSLIYLKRSKAELRKMQKPEI
jgi:hypothetical protein